MVDHVQNGYYRQIKYSPDDLCFSATKNDDKSLKIFNMLGESNFQKEPAITIKHGYTVYDHAWYPFLNSGIPESCLIATCSAGKGSCVRLFDAYSTGDMINSYMVYDQYVEPLPANSVEFSTCGNFI